jgi:hypothetical protein
MALGQDDDANPPHYWDTRDPLNARYRPRHSSEDLLDIDWGSVPFGTTGNGLPDQDSATLRQHQLDWQGYDGPAFPYPYDADDTNYELLLEQGLREIEEVSRAEGQLQAALAAGVNRIDRALSRPSAQYVTFQGWPEFQYSRSAAPLIGLRAALNYMLLELRGEPQWCHLHLHIEHVLDLARDRIVDINDHGSMHLDVYLPRTPRHPRRAEEVTGRKAFPRWLEAVGAAARCYREACLAILTLAGDEKARHGLTETWGENLFIGLHRLHSDEHLRYEGSTTAGQRLVGGYLQLLGMQYGFSVVHGRATPYQVELMVLDKVR